MENNKSWFCLIKDIMMRTMISLFLAFPVGANAIDSMARMDLTVAPPTPEDFIPEVKAALPKHLSYKSVKMTNVEEISRGPMVMYKCQLEIYAATSEPLYSMKEFKDGKYHIREVTPKGAEATFSAMSIVAPSPDGLPNIRVILLPKDPNNSTAKLTGAPLSKYKAGSYVIVK